MNRKTKFVGIITVLGLLVVMLAVLLTPLQVGAAGGVEPIIDYDAPFLPEGIALDKKGNIYVSLANQSELRKITPDGTESVLAYLPIGGFGLLGLAVDAPGNVYAALATTDPDTSGVYRVNRDGMSERLPGSESIGFPNALVFDKQGNLYVTDTTFGAVWLIPPGGEAELWLQDDLLLGTGDFGFPIDIGANGIVYRKNTIYVANTEKGSIVSIPVNKDGSAGIPVELIADSGLSGVDGLALDVHGDIYAVRVIGNELVRINMDTTELTVLASDGLDSPASLAFGTGKGDRQSVFIANFALISAANPGVVKVHVGVPGLPLP